MRLVNHTYDAVIVGAGGAGLMAALQLADHASVAVVSKLHPLRSHTGAAQGGIAAALGNIQEDHWEWHMYDTVKGGDYLGDQDAIEILCQSAPEVVIELEHMGLPFSRTSHGRIDQRPFGGHTRNFGADKIERACYAADRTGHMVLHTLYGQCLKKAVCVFAEFAVIDLVIEQDCCCGVTVYELATGEMHLIMAKAVLLATGGCGRVFQVTSNAFSVTGDGQALAFRHGIPLQDMEFFQFHPTGLYPLGILITEGARGEGGILRNSSGEPFMARYAPDLKDLAPRDLVTRAMYYEIQSGNGINNQDYLHLDLTHLPSDTLHEDLPAIKQLIETYLALNPAKHLVPVQPTAHYAMGGIPTDVDGRVLVDGQTSPFPGLFAAGECACVSVHGANRLGTNSLLETVVFGRRVGQAMWQYMQQVEPPPQTIHALDGADVVKQLRGRARGEPIGTIRQKLQRTMAQHAGVCRAQAGLEQALHTIEDLQNAYKEVCIHDESLVFNTSLVEALELGSLLDLAQAMVVAAQGRKESRGAHYREDFPQRDDAHYLLHSLVIKHDNEIALSWKPVQITRFPPEARSY